MMKMKLDVVVAEIVRNIDLEIVRHNPGLAKYPREQRLHVLFDFLRKEDVIKDINESGWPTLRPSARLERFFGVERHGIIDEYEDVVDPPAISSIHFELGKELDALGGAALEKEVGLIVSLFGMYRLGELEYCGKVDGMCQFRPTQRFKKGKSRRAPTSIVEHVGESGEVWFTER